jgi:hypothetical protein
VRIARDFGDISQLLPEGYSLKDVPHGLFDAIRQGLVFIGFQDLPEDEQPKKRIWHDGDALEEHFRAVRKRRQQMTDPRASGPIDDPVDNDAARLLIG